MKNKQDILSMIAIAVDKWMNKKVSGTLTFEINFIEGNIAKFYEHTKRRKYPQKK